MMTGCPAAVAFPAPMWDAMLHFKVLPSRERWVKMPREDEFAERTSSKFLCVSPLPLWCRFRAQGSGLTLVIPYLVHPSMFASPYL